MNHFMLQYRDISFTFIKTNTMASIVHLPQLQTVLGTALDSW